MKFRVIGAHKETGEDVEMTIDAADQHAAERWAVQNLIVWTSITPQAPPIPRTASSQATTYVAEKDVVNWLIALLAVLLTLLLTDRRIGFSANAIAQTLGAGFAYLLFAALFGLLGAKIGGKHPIRARVGFAIGSAIILIVSVLGEYRIGQQRTRDVAASARALAGQVRDLSQPISNPPSLSAREARGVNVLLAEIKQIYAEATKVQNDFQSRLTRIAGDGIIRPSQIETRAKINAASGKLVEFERLIDDRAAATEQMFADLPKRIERLNIDEQIKESALRGMQKTGGRSQQLTRQMLAADRRFVMEASSMLDFVQSRLGHFRVEHDEIYFEDDADVVQYNLIFTRLQKIVVEEQDIWRQIQDMAHHGAADLERLLRQD